MEQLAQIPHLIAALANMKTSAERAAQGAGPWDEYHELALDALIARARELTKGSH